jgi:opacity protein-like surface antigen
MSGKFLLGLAAGLLLVAPAAQSNDAASVANLSSELSLFQLGYDDEDDKYLDESELERWGATGAMPRNFRISFYFTGAYLMTTHITDANQAEHWNEVWRIGLGGGLGLAVQLAPILRIGGGVGYIDFHGGKNTYGTMTVDYPDMHCFPLHGEAALVFPLELAFESWFTPGRGFAPGFAPYLQVDAGLAYRMAVRAHTETGGVPGPDLKLFKSDAGVFVGARLGFEFRTDSVAFFIDFGYRLFNAPKEDDDIVGKVLEIHTLPVQCGFAMYFGA